MDRRDARMLRRVLAAISAGSALAGAGCSPRVLVDGEHAGTDDMSSHTSGSASTSTTTSASTTTTTNATNASTTGPGTTAADAATSDEPRFDVGPVKFDIGASPDVGGECFDPPNPAYPPCDAEIIPEHFTGYRCVPEVDGQCNGQDALDAVNQCIGAGCWGVHAWSVLCGPDPTVDGSCCYWVELSEGQICPGRPFTVAGRARLAPLVDGDAWARTCRPDVGALDATTRAALADAWAEDALFEHASVASFARFVLQLLALGAPPEQIEAAQRAMAEELEHARAFFGLASAYAGRPLAPDRLDVDGALDEHDPIAMAVSVAREGCIAETISSLQIRVAARRASDPTVEAMLTRIAEQELQHAELAWSHLRWVLERATPQLRAAVAQTFVHAATAVPRGPHIDPAADRQLLLAHGQLPVDTRVEIARDALHRIIAPAAATLLEPWTVTARRARIS